MRATRSAPPRRTARLRDVRGWVGGAARATPRAAHRKLRKLRPRELHHTHLARLLVILFGPTRPSLSRCTPSMWHSDSHLTSYSRVLVRGCWVPGSGDLYVAIFINSLVPIHGEENPRGPLG